LSFLVGKPIVVGYHHFRNPPYVVQKSLHHIPLPEAATSNRFIFGGPHFGYLPRYWGVSGFELLRSTSCCAQWNPNGQKNEDVQFDLG